MRRNKWLSAGQHDQSGWRSPALVLACCLSTAACFAQIEGVSDLHADGDGDGVADYYDRCGQTRAGVEVDDHGCADGDHDGIIDPVDRCPATPPNTDVDAWGCADSDGDGVRNPWDRCPATPKGEQVFANGCAARQLPQVQAVYFAVNSVALDERALAVIADIARVLVNAETFTLEVQGHTDASGAARYNLLLSRQRVDAVCAALIAAGLPETQIVRRAFGEAAPLEDNYSDQGRARNRRVSFLVKKRNSL